LIITNDLLLDLVIAYDGTISNSFLVLRTTSVDTIVALYYFRHEDWSSGLVVVHLYYVLFLRSSVDKHPMPSNISKLVVTPGLYSFCNDVSSE